MTAPRKTDPALAALLALALAGPAAAEEEAAGDWPQLRGPGARGAAEADGAAPAAGVP